MNQYKLDVVKQEMARVHINISGISELKWTDLYICYYGQEALRRNIGLKVNKRV